MLVKTSPLVNVSELELDVPKWGVGARGWMS